MSGVRVLGYAVAARDGVSTGGTGVCMDYAGELVETVEAAQAYATEPGDFVVAVCEVPS